MLIRIKEGKWGYYNTETGTIIDCQYDYVEDFVGEYAVVGLFSTETLDFGGSIATVDSSGRTIIDSSGNRFLQPIYDEIHIDDGFAIIQYRKHTGTFDLKKRVFVGLNKQELPRIFQAYDFAVEIAPGDVLTFTNGRVHWFHNEKEIVGDFSNVFPLNDSFYVFCHGWDRYGIMDKEARPILEPTYHSINLIAPNLAAAKNKRVNFGLEHGDHYEIFDISDTAPKKTCSVTGVISWIGGNVFSVFAASSQYFCADLYKGDVLFLGPNRPDTTIKLEYDFYGPYEKGHIETGVRFWDGGIEYGASIVSSDYVCLDGLVATRENHTGTYSKSYTGQINRMSLSEEGVVLSSNITSKQVVTGMDGQGNLITETIYVIDPDNQSTNRFMCNWWTTSRA